jgi:hypothetical protein
MGEEFLEGLGRSCLRLSTRKSSLEATTFIGSISSLVGHGAGGAAGLLLLEEGMEQHFEPPPKETKARGEEWDTSSHPRTTTATGTVPADDMYFSVFFQIMQWGRQLRLQ